jgi:hypothetical protein
MILKHRHATFYQAPANCYTWDSVACTFGQDRFPLFSVGDLAVAASQAFNKRIPSTDHLPLGVRGIVV